MPTVPVASSQTRAGHSNMSRHSRHPLHSSVTRTACAVPAAPDSPESTHGEEAMMTATPPSSPRQYRSASRSKPVNASTSYASASRRKATPDARTRSRMDTGRAGAPVAVTPSWGVGWWPVIAVVPLSRMTTMMRACWEAAFTRAGMPEWKNVESPMVATTVGNAVPSWAYA